MEEINIISSSIINQIKIMSMVMVMIEIGSKIEINLMIT